MHCRSLILFYAGVDRLVRFQRAGQKRKWHWLLKWLSSMIAWWFLPSATCWFWINLEGYFTRVSISGLEYISEINGQIRKPFSSGRLYFPHSHLEEEILQGFLVTSQTWNRILIHLRKYNCMKQPFDLFKSMSVTWFSLAPECRGSNSGHRILQQGYRNKVPIRLEKSSLLQPSKRLPFGKYPSSISGCFNVSPLDRWIRWANISPADLHMVTRYLSATSISLDLRC